MVGECISPKDSGFNGPSPFLMQLTFPLRIYTPTCSFLSCFLHFVVVIVLLFFIYRFGKINIRICFICFWSLSWPSIEVVSEFTICSIGEALPLWGKVSIFFSTIPIPWPTKDQCWLKREVHLSVWNKKCRFLKSNDNWF